MSPYTCLVCGTTYPFNALAMRCMLGHGEPAHVLPDALREGDRVVHGEGVYVVSHVDRTPSSAPWRVTFTWASRVRAIHFHTDSLVEVLR